MGAARGRSINAHESADDDGEDDADIEFEGDEEKEDQEFLGLLGWWLHGHGALQCNYRSEGL